MSMGLRFAALLAAGAPLLNNRSNTKDCVSPYFQTPRRELKYEVKQNIFREL